MMRRLILLLVMPAALWANGSRLPNQDARATARGDAFVATADSAAAVFYNPAGMTQLDGGDVILGSYVLAPKYDYDGPLGTYAAKRETFVLPHAYVARRLEGRPWAVGIGVFAPFGLATDWGTGTPLSTFASRNEIVYQTVALAVAREFSPTLSIGGAVHFNRIEVELGRDTGLAPGSELQVTGDDETVSGSVGFLWQASPGHFLGGRYSLATTADLRGELDFTPFAPTSPATGSLPFPDNLVISYAYRPDAVWNFEVSVDWTNWERLDTVTITNPVLPLDLVFDWESSLYFDLGLSYAPAGGPWTWHAGFVHSRNSVPDAVFMTSVSDDTRNFLSAGLEYLAGRFAVIGVLQHGLRTTRTVSGSPPSLGGFNADGRYTSEFWGGSLGLDWRF